MWVHHTIRPVILSAAKDDSRDTSRVRSQEALSPIVYNTGGQVDKTAKVVYTSTIKHRE
jgi:hypothetical protein